VSHFGASKGFVKLWNAKVWSQNQVAFFNLFFFPLGVPNFGTEI